MSYLQECLLKVLRNALKQELGGEAEDQDHPGVLGAAGVPWWVLATSPL